MRRKKIKTLEKIKEFNNGVWNAGGGPESSISPGGFLTSSSYINKQKLDMIRLKINEIIEVLNEKKKN